eukprot:TRINITY_DN1207_c0_g4_i1.p1 TRINITY_DN1207_c0_g4~~TRINITY_DN1207_c0_g4_i1.p1  ORF type:complete len:206 (-),score=43.48 TRINITY_DN1207_c0_g4_i1:190-756(-)
MERRRQNNLDRPLSKGKTEVSFSAFSLLFSEIVQYSQSRVTHMNELERRLGDLGYDVGIRVLELISYRENKTKRETRLLNILSFIHSIVWKVLFGRQADSVQKATGSESEYMITDKLLVTKFVSNPKDIIHLNCGAFVAGIIEGVLHGAEFTPESVSALWPNGMFQPNIETVFVIKFNPDVISRERPQ